MKDEFQRLMERTGTLGNHARKHLRAVERHGALLVARLESAGALSRVPLDRAAPALADSFRQLAACGRDPEESLRLIGTFYGVQYLHLCSRGLERLALDLKEKVDRRQAYRLFVRRAEEEFTSLASAYIKRVLKVLLPPHLTVPFVICAVGTRGHQDDIDVAVVDEGGESRRELDRVFSQLTVQMLRYASAFDHYLAERVGAERFCVSPEELSRKLHRGRLDFVVVTELMRAEPLVGNHTLYRRLCAEVIAPFMHREGEDNRRHELYLRSLLGEIRSLLLRPCPNDSINPKDDALRLILTLTLSFKTILGLETTRTRDTIRTLRSLRPDLRPLLGRLDRSLVFLETIRHIAQLVIAQEEQIDVASEAGRQQVRRLAKKMGYRDDVGIRAEDHLLVHYHEAVVDVRAAAEPLMDAVSRHLSTASRFASWAVSPSTRSADSSPALELAIGARAFRGVRFWDDILELFGDPESGLLDTFLRDYARQPSSRRRRLAVEYAEWGKQAPYALLSLIILLRSRSVAPENPDLARDISDAFHERLSEGGEEVRGLARVFRFYPDLMNRYLLTLDRGQLGLLLDSLGGSIGNEQVADARNRLGDLIRIHRRTSRYVKRVLDRLTVRHPAIVLELADDEALATFGQGRLAESERHLDREKQKGLLGDYYDMEFLRISLGVLHGRPFRPLRRAFTKLTEAYLRSVFDVCLRQVEQETGSRLVQRDRLGIFLAGGHARQRPFDEDYDVIAVIDSTDPEELAIAEKAVSRMNRQIARRGVIAQYHIGGRFGRFVVPLDYIASMLEDDEEDLLVDRHQLLGSRMVAGSRRVESAFIDRVLRPQIFEKSEAFVERLTEEVRDRRSSVVSIEDGILHLKEMAGGLRELDLVLAIIKARYHVYEPDEELLAEKLSRLDPERAGLYTTLRDAADFLVAVRSAYRVSVAASDVIEREFLTGPARILHEPEWSTPAGRESLFTQILKTAGRARGALDEHFPTL